MDWVLISVSNQRTAFSLAHRQFGGGTFSADYVFPGDSRLCEVDKNHPGQTEGRTLALLDTPRKHCRLSPEAELKATEKLTPSPMVVFALLWACSFCESFGPPEL